MSVFDIKGTATRSVPNSDFNLLLQAANPEVGALVPGSSFSTTFTLGTLDAALSIFPDIDTALAYYFGAQGAGMVSAYNTYAGTSYTLGVLTTIDTNTYNEIESKEAITQVATDIAAATAPLATEFATDEATAASLASTVANKVDKVTGEGLSTNDYTTAEKTKLASLAPQVADDWNETNSSAADFIKNKPLLPTIQAYEGTTQRLNAFPIIKSATVSSNVAVFNLTSDSTSGGTALFPNGVIQDSVQVSVNDATAAYQMSWAFSNSNKTLTVTANKLTTSNILTGVLGQAAANAAVVKLQIWGY